MKWCVLRDSIVDAASEVLGHRQRKQHDWYTESLSILEPLIAERNNLYSHWLQHVRSSDLQNFKNARSNTRAGVRKAKSDWISTHAELWSHCVAMCPCFTIGGTWSGTFDHIYNQ